MDAGIHGVKWDSVTPPPHGFALIRVANGARCAQTGTVILRVVTTSVFAFRRAERAMRTTGDHNADAGRQGRIRWESG